MDAEGGAWRAKSAQRRRARPCTSKPFELVVNRVTHRRCRIVANAPPECRVPAEVVVLSEYGHPGKTVARKTAKGNKVPVGNKLPVADATGLSRQDNDTIDLACVR